MNENINLIEILKDCPKGFPLYSTIYGNVLFLKIVNNTIKFTGLNGVSYGPYAKVGYVHFNGLHNSFYDGECTLFPSKDQRDWSKFTAPWYKKEKFDPKTFKPFDKVLVKQYDKWVCDFCSYYIEDVKLCVCVGLNSYLECIPYNDDTKHLVGTTDEAPEYYRYWED